MAKNPMRVIGRKIQMKKYELNSIYLKKILTYWMSNKVLLSHKIGQLKKFEAP